MGIDSKQAKLRKIVLDLLREHEQAGEDALPTSGRFLFYELVQRGVLDKHKPKGESGRRSDQPLHDALTQLRQSGAVPWEWIDDETRSLDDYTGWPTIDRWATTSVKHVRLDPWQGRAPLILTESRSVAGALRKLAIRYCTKIAPTNGQVGGFLHTDVAPQLSPGDRVLYIGDFDWQGGQIEANTRRVLEQLVGELDWERIALTEQQLDQYDLRRLQIMKADRRYKPVRYHPAVETEALSQQVLVGIVRAQLDAELPEPLEHVLEREQEQRDRLARLLRRRRA
jgi:hypothetical protein